MREMFVDNGLFQPGNRAAIKILGGLAAQRINKLRQIAGVEHDDLLDWLERAMSAFAAGKSPDEAFEWTRKRGTVERNLAKRNWEIKMDVQEKMRDGFGFEDACAAVSASESGGPVPRGIDTIKSICRGINAESDLPVPDDIFPFET